MAKVKAFGVDGHLLGWLEQWLTGRMQRVVLNGKKYKWTAVKSGVPQGSVLGPLLFSIFISDLDQATVNMDIVKKFADDTKMAKVVSGEADRAAIQKDLDSLCGWATKWGMAFNIPKCKVMHLGHNNPKFSYTMVGQPMVVTDKERDIGVTVSKNLRPGPQCEKVARVAKAVLKQIKSTFHYRDRHIFRSLYIQYVRPHLEYAVQAWAPWMLGDIACLEKVQEKAVRMVTGLQGKTYEDRLIELNLTSLRDRRTEQDMMQTYKILHGHDRVDSNQWFVKAAQTGDGARTRLQAGTWNLRPQHGQTEVRRNFFSQRVVPTWNSLPEELRSVRTITGFKNGYRKFKERN